MHNEPSTQTLPLPPPLPLSYEQETKSNGFLDFPNHHPSLDSNEHQQYSNFIPHNAYHHSASDEQYYPSTRNSFSSYAYPYSLPYPSLALDTGSLSLVILFAKSIFFI